MTELTGRGNDKIKQCSKLLGSARQRREQGLFVTEGVKLCLDAFDAGYRPVRLFVTRQRLEKSPELERVDAEEKYVITEDISRKLTQVDAPQGVFCEFEASFETADLSLVEPGGRYIAAENVQNPDNIGALLRTAEALGLDGVIVCGGCDVYSPKVLRASMGSSLREKLYFVDDTAGAVRYLEKLGIPCYACVVRDYDCLVTDVDFSSGAVCVIGNEGSGLTEDTAAACSKRITIPMGGRAESLNAAQAACIVMWEMTR